MTLYKWSQTASADATADSTINWAEGQAPSSINDSARAMMAATAKYRDDISGTIVTAGTPTAYTVASYQVFDTLAHLHGRTIAFTPHATNGATVTLNVDSLGAKPLRSAPNIELPAGVLIQGTPYMVVYNNSDAVFYLHGFFGNPYDIPIASGMDYWGSTAPNSSFAFAYGQAISRTTYASLFALLGTTYGAGDGAATFNLPDKRGRVSAAADNMGGSFANRITPTYFGGNYPIPGIAGGSQSHLLGTNEMPSHYHVASIYDPGHTHSSNGIAYSTSQNIGASNFVLPLYQNALTINAALTGVRVNSSNGLDTTYSAGGDMAHTIMQPTIICNYIIRVL
jgi:microcystin-dependent protein